MKRILSAVLILAIGMLMFSGCGANSKAAFNAKDKEILAQLNAMKEQQKKPKEMFEYINQNVSGLKKSAATEAVGLLVSTLEEYETSYNEKLFTGSNPDLMYQYFNNSFDYGKIESIKETELKELLYDITLGGFKIVDTEGTFMVIVDYEALKTFDSFIDDELKSYIDIMALRYSSPVTADASLLITPEELQNRIMQMEDYIIKCQNQERRDIMLSMYEGNIMVFMSGADNTPVFDYDTGALNPEMFKVFEASAAKYKDAIFGKLMSKYVELLKQENFINTEKVQDFILNIDTNVNEELQARQKK